MSGKSYKGKKKGAGRFVQLPEWLQASEAWATLKCGPRALYIELKRRYTGSNNGRIFLSHREAAKALNVHRNTVGGWFQELERRGFIQMRQGAYLGPSGVGQSALWLLTELPADDMKSASNQFMSWTQNQNPRTNIVQARHKKQDSRKDASPADRTPVLKIVTQ